MALSPIVSKLRLTLAILALGFVIEGGIEAVTYLGRSYRLPYAALILILAPFVTLSGILVLWMGRRQWNDLLSRQFRHAHRTFGLGLLALVGAVAILVWASYGSPAPISSWISRGFGAMVMASLLLTFATYVLLALHLTAFVGKTLLLVALGWAAVVSFWIGQAFAQNFDVLVLIVRTGTFVEGPLYASIVGLGSYLAGTYALLIMAYVDAFRRVLAVSRRRLSTPVAPPAL